MERRLGSLGWALMALMMLIFWGGVVTVVILLLRRSRGSEPPWPSGPYAPAHDEAERILNERFARGKIDETEFTARRTALRRNDDTAFPKPAADRDPRHTGPHGPFSRRRRGPGRPACGRRLYQQ
ncbi:SHOCT domain-containing protein [Pseudarthrobacter sp. J1738]|uniref:SHOCT domain-containing protein n=1 Tax=unclassified Pseudarthrobacter TaxID=2647000 RepID=UPI003D2BDB1E